MCPCLVSLPGALRLGARGAAQSGSRGAGWQGHWVAGALGGCLAPKTRSQQPARPGHGPGGLRRAPVADPAWRGSGLLLRTPGVLDGSNGRPAWGDGKRAQPSPAGTSSFSGALCFPGPRGSAYLSFFRRAVSQSSPGFCSTSVKSRGVGVLSALKAP